MAQIKQDLSRMNAAKLIETADKQNKLMAPTTGTPPIPNMAATIAEQVTAHDDAIEAGDAYEAAKAALGALKTTRDEKGDVLRGKLAITASKAQSESKGEPAPLQAAGYVLASETATPSGPVPQLQNLAVTAGDSDGSLDASGDPPAGVTVKSYQWQYTTADPVNGPYTDAEPTSASSTTISGLTSGHRVWVRVRGVGPKGAGPWSDPATKIVP